ncbi:hypothetical protein SSYRP_v1c01640 [Spiroplasma syrphidicola EA-1]|uniref:Uncharacterized protein n=1 Tax=Spiroplasma syrphidicola EA-1 TaxID=1276229 RepID=R4UHZ4_9MOLU|nr:hypothetical protein [Spiroplasma syrphidicola]AGM25760.1 hypothetical protein SSYRP_v1c01640 [Spiroplasma syrphidicola EA-1]
MSQQNIKQMYEDIKNQLKLIIDNEKITDSTNPIMIVYEHLQNLRYSGRVVDITDFTNKLNIILADSYKTLSLRISGLLTSIRELAYSYFKEKVDTKSYYVILEKESKKFLKDTYGNKLKDIDFIFILYHMTNLLQKALMSISLRKLSDVTV